jgi:hypothetical protein
MPYFPPLADPFISFPSLFMSITDKGAAAEAVSPEQDAANAAKASSDKDITPTGDAQPGQHDWQKRANDSKKEALKMLEVQVDMVLENPEYLEKLASKDRHLAETVSKRLTIDGAPAQSLEQALEAITGQAPARRRDTPQMAKAVDEEELLAKVEARQEKKRANEEVKKALEGLPEAARKLALEKWDKKSEANWSPERVREEAEMVMEWAKSKAGAPAKRDLSIASLASSGRSVPAAAQEDSGRKEKSDKLAAELKKHGWQF